MLYDRLPGGTGYLHRLVDPEAFRDTLAEARRALLVCECQHEVRLACHRCLHRHTEERFQDIVSRREALDILGELLGPVDENGVLLADAWEVESVSDTGLIGLDRQVESDLEARFLTALREWVATDDGATLDEDSRASGYLRFTAPDGVVRWRLIAQQELGYTRSDFTFQRVDGPAETITVYLDGHRNHATTDRNRLAGDAEKRSRLRAEGRTVFQITWDDLDLFERRQTSAEPVWPPYLGLGQQQAKEAYGRLGGERAHLADAVFTNPIETMLAYLRDPDRALWGRRSAAAVAGLTIGSTPVALGVDRTSASAALRTQLAGDAASPSGAAPGTVHVLRAEDRSGLPLVLMLDATQGDTPAHVAWSALAILDDQSGDVGTAGHKLQWRAWLYWSNLLQFLDDRGDGVQLTTGRAAAFPVETLAALHGGDTTPTASAPVPLKRRDRLWDNDILPLLDDDEESLIRLAKALAAEGKQAPVFGHELGERRWLVDFAWPRPDVKIAIQGRHGAHDEEALRRDRAYAEAGWNLRTASEWLEHLDTLLPLIPDVEIRGRA